MKTKATATLILAFMFVLSASFVATPTAEAACSINGYYNSGGACASSYKIKTKPAYNYQYRYQNQINYRYNDAALRAMIERLQEMIRILQKRLDDDRRYETLSVSTRSATNIGDDSATLRGRVSLHDKNEAEVYFEYGRSRTNFSKETRHRTIKDRDSSYNFTSEIEDLNDDTLYYFRAVAKDEDSDDGYGVTLSFRTNDNDENNDEPELNTREAEDIEDNSAELHGTVDMNDFDNGEVFFVYGEDKDQIEDVQYDYDTYGEIDEDGDDLQKVLVDSDLDSSANYRENVENLEENTKIYYSICVEYEDYDDDTILGCGDVEVFRTDN